MICAVLRLARFNVENTPDPASHKRFRGLPSPGAAGCLASLAILRGELPAKLAQHWMEADALLVIEHRAARSEPDDQRDQEHQRGGQEEPHERHRDIEGPLRGHERDRIRRLPPLTQQTASPSGSGLNRAKGG